MAKGDVMEAIQLHVTKLCGEDSLARMFQCQRELGKLLGNDVANFAARPEQQFPTKIGRTQNRQQYLEMNALAMLSEVIEFIDWTRWKPWSLKQEYRPKEALFELVDLLHFTINAVIAMGFSAEEFAAAFFAKNGVNRERANGGY